MRDFTQYRHIARLPVPKMKIRADVNGGGIQLVTQDLTHEIYRRQSRERDREWQDDQQFDALLLDQSSLDVERSKQLGGTIRRQHRCGMGIEGNCGGNGIQATGGLYDALQQLLMRQVDAIEITDRHRAPGA